jgi:hypothetical protein
MYDALLLLLIERKIALFCPFCAAKSKKFKKKFATQNRH